MSEAVAQKPAGQPSSGFIKLVLSSSVATAGVALLGTMTGLMFRAGWLGVYGLSPETFMPDSATELAYWGFLAILFTLSDVRQWLTASGMLLLGAALGYGVLVAAALAITRWANRRKDWMKNKLSFLKDERKLIAGMGGVAAASVVLVPWVLFSMGTLLIAAPIFGHSAGKSAAEKSRLDYETRVKANQYDCTQLVANAAAIGQCPTVIAQSKDRIAYLDGNRVHIIPSQGISISETLKPLTPPKK